MSLFFSPCDTLFNVKKCEVFVPPHANSVLGVQKRHWNPLHWCYKELIVTVLVINLGPLEEQPLLLTLEPLLLFVLKPESVCCVAQADLNLGPFPSFSVCYICRHGPYHVAINSVFGGALSVLVKL